MKHYRKFWLFVLAPIFLVGIVGYFGREFVGEAIARNPQLNLSIILVIVGSVILVLFLQFAYWREAKTLVLFRDAYHLHQDLQQAGDAIAGNSTAIASALNMITRIGGHLGNSLDQHALTEELEHLKEGYQTRVALPHFLSGFMVALGLFGTFIGLLETLSSTSDLLARFSGGNVADMGQAVSGILSGMRAPLGGMATSFSASLFGLLGSLVLGLMLNSIEAMSYRILHELRSLVDEMVGGVGSRQSVKNASDAPSLAFLNEFLGRILTQQQVAADLFDESRKAEMETRINLLLIASHLGDTTTMMDRIVTAMEVTQEMSRQQDSQAQFLLEQISKQTVLIDAMERQTRGVEQHSRSTEAIVTEIREVASALAATQQMIVKVGHHENGKHFAFLEASMQSIDSYQKMATATQAQLEEYLVELKQMLDQGREIGRTAAINIGDQVNQSNILLKELVYSANRPQGSSAEAVVYIQALSHELKKNREMLSRDLTAEMRELARSLSAQVKTHAE